MSLIRGLLLVVNFSLKASKEFASFMMLRIAMGGGDHLRELLALLSPNPKRKKNISVKEMRVWKDLCMREAAVLMPV